MTRCHKGTHVRRCRKARPLCRERRKESENRKPCECAAYSFPHRNGSGHCGHPERRMLEEQEWYETREALARERGAA
jgi:hypothetical protein